MEKELHRVTLPADSDLALSLKRASRDGEPLVVDTGEDVYSVSVDTVVKAAETPSADEIARSREGIVNASGGWKDIDTEAFKAYLARRRRASRRPRVRL